MCLKTETIRIENSSVHCGLSGHSKRGWLRKKGVRTAILAGVISVLLFTCVPRAEELTDGADMSEAGYSVDMIGNTENFAEILTEPSQSEGTETDAVLPEEDQDDSEMIRLLPEDAEETEEPSETTETLSEEELLLQGEEDAPEAGDSHPYVTIRKVKNWYGPKVVRDTSYPYTERIDGMDDGIYISWENGGDEVDGFYIYCKNMSTGETTRHVLKNPNASSFVDTSVKEKNGTVFEYKVSSYKGDQEYAYRYNPKRILRMSVPFINKIENKQKTVLIQWNKVPGAEGYMISIRGGNGEIFEDPVKVKGENTLSCEVEIPDEWEQEHLRFFVVAYKGESSSAEPGLNGTSWRWLKPPYIKEIRNEAKGILLIWDKTANTQYNIYRKTESSGWKLLKTTFGRDNGYSNMLNQDKCFFLDTEVAAVSGENYRYTIRANSGYLSDYYRNGRTITRISTPSVSRIENRAEAIYLKWDRIENVEGYNIYRRPDSSKAWKKIAALNGQNTVTYLDQSVKNDHGIAYVYTIRARIGKEEGAYEEGRKLIRLLPPGGVETYNSSRGVHVKWQKVEGVTGYGIYRKDGNGAWKQIAKVNGGDILSYYDTTVQNSYMQTFTYSVKSRKDGFTSDINAAGSIVYRLAAPKLTEICNSKGNIVWLRWKTVPMAEGYQVQYSVSSDFRNAKKLTVTGGKTSTCKITGLEKGKLYYFRVFSFRKAGGRNILSGIDNVQSIAVVR